MKKEALLYDKLPHDEVQCRTCQRRCTIAEGDAGWCLTRVNERGTLYTRIYGEVSSLSVNPIEKKPVFHFYPGSRWLSLGSWGCNFRCPGCQNWDIAHWKGKDFERGSYLAPKNQVEMALRYGCLGLSWTFNEPTLWFEYTLDTAKLAKKKGLYTNYVTNGFITEEAFDLLAPYLDVYRVDIKGFSNTTYKKIAHIPEFGSILKVAEKAKECGIHVEVVTNIIPGFNDDDIQLQGIASWIHKCLGPDTPWHVTRFYPDCKLAHVEETPITTLEHAQEIGKNCGIRYVYLGNVPGHKGENTYCYNCSALLIKRYVFDVVKNRIQGGKCPECGATIVGRF
ncbi:MAG: AmmeMemoRadiSam system radical SAM enzyme [Deltaproteobacteria bacterium]|nr:AmmeMemoRadiSam system radical SAM enzyme [Deltaproteobacteria bacterium]